MQRLAVVRGAGDLATAVGRRLHLAGFRVAHLEIAAPTVIRRAVAFASAAFEGRCMVEGVEARLASDARELLEILAAGSVALLVDPRAESVAALQPALLVDAVMAKRNTGTRIGMAPRVVALGPGFKAGVDAHAVVETQRGHDLGRVLWSGSALPDTGVPGEIGGVGAERVLRTPCAGRFSASKTIGDTVSAGEAVASVGDKPVLSAIAGVLRGLLHDGLEVHAGQKAGDVDPRGDRRFCFTLSDKANAVAGGVLEAALTER